MGKFLRRFADEVKTPVDQAQQSLTLVRQAIQELGQHLPPQKLDRLSKAFDSLNVAVDGTNVASFLLDDAMEISDKGTTIYDKSIVDFNHVLPSVVKLFVGTAKARNITFRTEQPFNEATFIYMDRIRIAQVLRSMLDYAFKATEDGGTVVISVTKGIRRLSSRSREKIYRSGNTSIDEEETNHNVMRLEVRH